MLQDNQAVLWTRQITFWVGLPHMIQRHRMLDNKIILSLAASLIDFLIEQMGRVSKT